MSSGESQALDTEHGEVICGALGLGSVKCSEDSCITVTKTLKFMIINESQQVHMCFTALYPLVIALLCVLLGNICAIFSGVYLSVFRFI